MEGQYESMFNTECSDCKRVFTSKTDLGARQALGRHRARAHGWVSPTAKHNKAKAKPHPPQIASLEKARAASWARYWRQKMERAAANPAIQKHYDEVVTRDTLQASSWWQVEDGKRTITCPCCEAQFVIVRGSK